MAAPKKTPAAGQTGSRSTQKKTTQSRQAKTPSSARQRSGKASAPRKGEQLTLQEQGRVWSSIWLLMRSAFFGRVFLVLLFLVLLAAVNLLIAGNSYDRFALLLGIEMIAAGLIAWAVYLYRNRDEFFQA